MTWWGWLLLVVAMALVFILWDLVVRGGKRCARLADRFVVDPRVSPATRDRRVTPPPRPDATHEADDGRRRSAS